MDLMSLLIRIGADTAEAEKGINSVQNGMDETAKKSTSFGTKFGNAFKTAGKIVAGTTAAVVACGAAVFKLASNAASTTDHIDKMSQKLGISREAYQELDFVMSQSGTSIDSMQMGMKTLRSQMDKVNSGNKDATKTFKRLGIQVKNTDGTFRRQEDVFFDAVTALQGVTDETEKAQLATELFGRSGTELLPLLNGEVGSMEELRKEAHRLGIVLDDDAIDAGVHLTDTIDKVKRSFDAIITKIGVEVMPMVQSALDWVLDNMPMIQEVVSGVFSVIAKVVGGAVKFFVETVVPFIKKFIDNNVKPNLMWFESAFTALGLFFKELFEGDIGMAFKRFRTFIDDLVYGILQVFGVGQEDARKIAWEIREVVGWLLDIFKGLIDFVKDVFAGDWESAWKHIKKVFKKVWEGISTFFSGLFEKAVELIKAIDWAQVGKDIWNWIKGAFSTIGTWFLERFESAKTAIQNVDWAAAGKAIWDWIKKAFTNIGTWFMGRFEAAKTAIKNVDWAAVGTAIWDWIKQAFLDIGTWYLNTFKAVKEKIESVDWEQLGKDIWDWIKKAFASIGTWFLGRFETAKTAIKNVDWAGVGKDIWDWIKGAFTSIGTWFEEKFEEAVTFIESIDWAAVGTAIWDAIKGAITGVGEWFTNTFKEPINAVIDMLNGLIGTAEGVVNTVIRGINKALTISIPAKDFGILGSFGGWSWSPGLKTVSWNRIDRLATGGFLGEGQSAIVGEYRPERLSILNGHAFVQPIGGVNPGDRFGNGSTYNNTVNIYQQPGETSEELAERVERVFVRWQKQEDAVWA